MSDRSNDQCKARVKYHVDDRGDSSGASCESCGVTLPENMPNVCPSCKKALFMDEASFKDSIFDSLDI